MKKIFFIIQLFFLCCTGITLAEETVVFAIDPTKPPMQFVNEGGRIVGFEIDLLEEMGRQAGFRPVFKQVPWQEIFEGLNKDKYDAVCASVSMTDERKKLMDFTIPYYRVAQALLTSADTEIRTVSDLQGKKVGVKNETTSLQTINRFQDVEAVKFNSVPEAIKALLDGKIDAVICDGPVAGYYSLLEKEKGLEIALVLEQEKIELYGIAIKKGNREIRSKLNRAIVAVQKKNKDLSLQNKWFRGLLERK